jgi:cytochrome oxidase Cu insertion factor (SCO1/SenC/PrrC family)
MKLRILGIAFLLLSVVSPGNSQMKSSGGIEINEKLGSPVAMDVVLKDENGGDITLRRLIDKPTILIFNYFRCPGICPVLINNVVDVVNRISLEPGKDYRLIAISFDPKDTPQLASEKKANYLNQMRRQFPPTAWHFLTGTAENTKKVADSRCHYSAYAIRSCQPLFVRHKFCSRGCGDWHPGSGKWTGAPNGIEGIGILLYLRPGRPQVCTQHHACRRNDCAASRGGVRHICSERKIEI